LCKVEGLMAVIHIHAGLPKTGSSAIQAFLGANAQRLGTSGLLVPATGRDEAGHHHHLFQSFGGLHPFRAKALCSELECEIAASRHGVVLLLSEFAYLCLRWWLAARTYRRLMRAGHRLIFHLFVRPQADLAVSLYPEVMRNLLTAPDFTTFLSRGVLPEIGDYGRLARRLGTAGAVEVRLLPYTLAARRDGVWWSLLASAGLSVGRHDRLVFIEPGDVNRSPGPVGTAALATAIRQLERRGGIRRIGERLDLRRVALDVVREFPAETRRYQPLSASDREQIGRECAAANEAIAARHFGQPWHEIFNEEAAANTSRPVDVFDPANPRETELHDMLVARLLDVLVQRRDALARGRARRRYRAKRLAGAQFDHLAEAMLRQMLRRRFGA